MGVKLMIVQVRRVHFLAHRTSARVALGDADTSRTNGTR
jgi:hypothetical protein